MEKAESWGERHPFIAFPVALAAFAVMIWLLPWFTPIVALALAVGYAWGRYGLDGQRERKLTQRH